MSDEEKVKAGVSLDAEIAACFRRADLKPSETPNTGFKLDHHYAATAAAGPLARPGFKLPMARPVYSKPKAE